MANCCALSKLLLFSISLPSLVLLLVLVLCSDTVICHSNVKSLPGFTGTLPFEMETGYIGVDEDNDVQLFYYFIKSERNPFEDPLILWISGGPGCSAFSGLAFEIGPFNFNKAEYNGTSPTLVLNPNSWTKISNIIFLDAPVGTGFSYSRSSQGSYNEDTKSAKQSYNFLIKWLIDHPEFLSNPLYIGGDSYSGLTTPMISLHISNGNKAGNEPVINLKGYLLGNPVTDRTIEGNSKIPYAHGMGLISNELYESTKKRCGEEYVNVDPSNRECIKALQAVSECTCRLEVRHILEPLCALASAKPKEIVGQRRRSLNDNSSKFFLSKPRVPELECRNYGYMLSATGQTTIECKRH